MDKTWTRTDKLRTKMDKTWIFKTIISEMARGNFSFLILAVGILQLIVMIRKR